MKFTHILEAISKPVEEIIEESFNDDDWYIMNSKTKKMVKHLGKISVPYGSDPSSIPRIKAELKSADYVAMKGMKAKHFSTNLHENADHATLLKIAQKGHLRALRKGDANLAKHYAKRMAFHTQYVVR